MYEWDCEAQLQQVRQPPREGAASSTELCEGGETDPEMLGQGAHGPGGEEP